MSIALSTVALLTRDVQPLWFCGRLSTAFQNSPGRLVVKANSAAETTGRKMIRKKKNVDIHYKSEDEEGELMIVSDSPEWKMTQPPGFGINKIYDTTIEDALIQGKEEALAAASLEEEKEKAKKKKKKKKQELPDGIYVRLFNLPKKRKITRDLRAAFKSEESLLHILPDEKGTAKTRDPICTGSAILTFPEIKEAQRFVAAYAKQKIKFGKVEKIVRYEVLKESPFPKKKPVTAPRLKVMQQDEDLMTSETAEEAGLEEVHDSLADIILEETGNGAIVGSFSREDEEGRSEEEHFDNNVVVISDYDDSYSEEESSDDVMNDEDDLVEEEEFEQRHGVENFEEDLGDDLMSEDEILDAIISDKGGYSIVKDDEQEEKEDDDVDVEEEEDEDEAEEKGEVKGKVVVKEESKGVAVVRKSVRPDIVPKTRKSFAAANITFTLNDAKRMSEVHYKIKELELQLVRCRGKKMKEKRDELAVTILGLREEKIELLEKRVFARFHINKAFCRAKLAARDERRRRRLDQKCHFWRINRKLPPENPRLAEAVRKYFTLSGGEDQKQIAASNG